jgi:hypothetical protein
MFRSRPELIYQQVRDHLERAIAILHNDEAALPIRSQIEEAVELVLECTYRRSYDSPDTRSARLFPALEAANDNLAD